ncbi:MAG: NUDIX hydrolase, partial [Gemmatimonadota bacterium]
LLLRERETVEALFVLRADIAGDPWSGHVALPGGHADPADPDLLDTARRELREETGLALDRGAYLGRLDDLGPSTRRLPAVAVTPWVAWHEGDESIRINAELRGHLWIPLPALAHPDHRSELRLRREDEALVFPSIEFGGYTIWGLTFRIVDDFLTALEEPSPPSA